VGQGEGGDDEHQLAQPGHGQQQGQQEGDVVVADQDVAHAPGQEVGGHTPDRRLEAAALEPQVTDPQASQLLPLVVPADPDQRPVAAGQPGKQADPRLQPLYRSGRLELQRQRHARDRRTGSAGDGLEQGTQRPGPGNDRPPIQPHRQLPRQVPGDGLAVGGQLRLAHTDQFARHRRARQRHHLGQTGQAHIHRPGHAPALDDDVRARDRFVVGARRRCQHQQAGCEQHRPAARPAANPATMAAGHDGCGSGASDRASAAPASPAARQTSTVATR
jgi:hypothetical protein